MPTGEYRWNHANGSMLRDFLVNTYVGGASGLANPNIDGVFLDDGWGSVRRHDIAAIWVAFFSRCQRYRC